MILVPLPRFVFPILRPLFRGCEACVDECLSNINRTSRGKFVCRSSHNPHHYPRADPLLKPPLTGLKRRVSVGSGAPVRKTHRTPFITDRRLFQGRPRPSRRFRGSGISGTSTFHWSSVKSCASRMRVLMVRIVL